MSYGLPVADVLRASTLAGARVLAGAAGLSRLVQRLNVMEVPDILPWVKPHELLLTTGYPLRRTPQALDDLVGDLAQRGLAGLAIKLGRYIDELPDAMLRQADRLRFPVIQIPDGVGFDDILNQVLTDILNRQAVVLARSEEVHRALVQIVLAGGGLAEIAEELVSLLGGAVLIAAADGRVLAAAGGPAELAAARSAGCVDETGRLRLADLGGTAGRPAATPAAAAGCTVVPIAAGPVDHGRIVAVAQRPLTPFDVHILERAATVAALVIVRQLAVTAVDSLYQADFLRDLLDGRAGEPDRTVPHSRSLGWDIDRPCVVVVARLAEDGGGRDDQPDGAGRGSARPAGDDPRGRQDRFAAAWAAVVRRRDRQAAVVGFAREVVAVLGAGADPAPVVREIAGHIAADLPRRAGRRMRFGTGFSRVVARPQDLPVAYRQACRAAETGSRLYGGDAVVSFDALGVFRLLSLVPDPGELTSFAAETLGALAEPGRPESADLRRTLRVLLDCNLNVAESARALHFHYNTLRYRITKLERLVGPFTTDPRLRLDVALALRIVEMRTG